jgi:hypothetical protein
MPPKKKKGGTKAKAPPRVYLEPPAIIVADVAGKGKGVVAAEELAPNSRLKYVGNKIKKKNTIN